MDNFVHKTFLLNSCLDKTCVRSDMLFCMLFRALLAIIGVKNWCSVCKDATVKKKVLCVIIHKYAYHDVVV